MNSFLKTVDQIAYTAFKISNAYGGEFIEEDEALARHVDFQKRQCASPNSIIHKPIFDVTEKEICLDFSLPIASIVC
jgi:hypothetical protein